VQPDAVEIGDALTGAWEQHRERLFESFRTVSEWLVDEIDPQPGEILEVTAGPGETGFIAAERVGADGRLIPTDAAPAWLRQLDGAPRRVASATSSAVSWTPSRSTCLTPASTELSPGLA
jgi:hypothetical protein